MSDSKRDTLKETLRSLLEQTLDERVDRYLSVSHQWITGDHHFAHASSEAVALYRDGYYTSCIMVTQAVSEAIIRFVAERNCLKQTQAETKQALARRAQQAGIISRPLLDAFVRIQCSFRNDFHHMNPPVARINLESLAKRNVTDLAVIEREIFECGFGSKGTIVPRNPLYWDVSEDGWGRAYLRLQ